MADHPSILPVASFCAGVGMLDLGFGCAVRGVEPVLYVEREVAAARVLASRMQDLSVARAPVWSDLTTLNLRRWRGRLFGFTAGLPCQPYSVAGKQRGNQDERSHGEDGSGPVPHFCRLVDEARPAVVFLENVPAWVMGGHFRSVGEELSRLGYTVEEPMFIAAEDVGASHRRERVFILAHAKDSDWWGRVRRAQEGTWQGEQRGWRLAGSGAELAVSASQRLQGLGQQRPSCGARLSDGGSRADVLPIFAPGPNAARWREILAADPSIEPAVHRMADGLAARVDRLRATGNGVVPLQAAVAAHVLLYRAGLGWLCAHEESEQ